MKPVIVLLSIIIAALFISFLLIYTASYSGIVVNKEIRPLVYYEPGDLQDGYYTKGETVDRYWFVLSHRGVYSWVEVSETLYSETSLGDYVTVTRKLN